MRKLVAVLSLLLAAAATAIAVRGRYADDVVMCCSASVDQAQRTWEHYGGKTYNDASCLFYTRKQDRGSPPKIGWQWDSSVPKPSGQNSPFVFKTGRDDGDFGYDHAWAWYVVYVKHWLLIGSMSLLAVLMNWKAWRRKPGTGHCQACGYDLRASPERCPECGVVPRRTSQTDPVPRIELI